MYGEKACEAGDPCQKKGEGVRVSSEAPAWVEKLLELKGMDRKTGTVTTDGEDVFLDGVLIGNRSEVE